MADNLPIANPTVPKTPFIPIRALIGGIETDAVDARSLHVWLGVGEKFADWFKRRADEALLIEGTDYESFSEISEKPQSGRPAKEYVLTVDATMHVAMLERTEIGRMVRQDAIEWKKRAKAMQRNAGAGQASVRRVSHRRTQEEIAIARAEAARVQAQSSQIVQQGALATAEGYAGFLQRALGLDANAAFVGGCNAAKAACGVDIRQITAITHIESETQQTWHTPTELGKIENGLSAVKINQTLEAAGLQTKPDGKQWEPTEAGKKYSRILDTGKKHGSGVPVTQLKWSKDVLQKMSIKA
jgi:phage anti-repressor protein